MSTILSKEDLIEGLSGMMLIEDRKRVFASHEAQRDKIEELERKLTKAEGLNKVDKMQISIMHDNDDKSYAKIEELEIKVNTWKTKYFDKDRDGIALERALDDACEMLTELLKDLLKLGVERGALTGSPEEYIATLDGADKLKQHFIDEAKKEN